MKKKTMIILGVSGAVLAAGGVAVAKKGPRGGHHGGKFMMEMFSKADTDGDKAISTAEFNSVLNARFGDADADKDGKVTKAEAVGAIEKNAKNDRMKRRAGRMADRLVNRFDIDKDGVVSKQEFENRATKFYALADWNDDGKVEVAELKRTGRGMRGGRGGGWRGGDHRGKHSQRHEGKWHKDANDMDDAAKPEAPAQ